MTSEIGLAFAHPDERAAAMAGDPPLDRISLRDHIVEVDIGAFQVERGVTQRVCFNLVVEVQPWTGPLEDDVDRILSYDRLTEAIAFALAEERLNLLETLAARVAELVLREPQAVRVFVRIEKLDRVSGALGVEIVRSRGDLFPEPADSEALHPRLAYLSNAAIASPHLAGWIDQLAQPERPLVLCVGAHDDGSPGSDHPLTQRRIDLLAIEQNAWVLASRDARCVVVGTRTELDWAMRNGQICVWAPSKIVLDAVDGPSASPQDSVALAAWFATLFEAEDLLVIGAELPENPGLPLRSVSAESAIL